MASTPPQPALVLDNTFGALFIGVVLAGFLLGISCIQALCYYTQQEDRWPLKATVTVVMIIDIMHQVLITHAAYRYLVTYYDSPLHLGILQWSIVLEIIFNGFAAFIVQSFMTMRIYILSNRNIFLTAAVYLLVLAEFVSITVFWGITRGYKTFLDLVHIKSLSITVNALAAATDVLIAVTLTLILHRSRTGFQRSDTIINKLIIFAVNTGALTSLCALASLISITVAGNTFIYITFFFCMGRLYSNTLLATLNARSIIRNTLGSQYNTHTGTGADAISRNTKIPTSAFGNGNPANISIKIDTKAECEDKGEIDSGVELKSLPV